MKRALSILFAVVLALSFSLMATPVAAGTITVGPGGPPTYDYATIQAAVSAASSGDTIMVAAGTYNEHVIINKSLTLQGEDRGTTIIDGGGSGSVIYVSVNHVTISGLKITNGADGVKVPGSWSGAISHLTIRDTIIDSNEGDAISCLCHTRGYWLIENCIMSNNGGEALAQTHQANHFIIRNCEIYGNGGAGLSDLGWGSNAVVKNNSIHHNGGRGICFDSMFGSLIENNEVYCNGGPGIYLQYVASDNTIRDNIICDNYIGIVTDPQSGPNSIYHNDLIDNTVQAWDRSGQSSWHNGYPSGGNYWSDYIGVDNFSGPGQNLPGSDGIGDTPYVFDGNQDNYPLMEVQNYMVAQCVATATGTGTACFTSSHGIIVELTAMATPPRAPVELPHGMFNFTVCCFTGSTVTLNITFPDPIPVGYKWWKYVGGSWYSLPIGSDDGDSFITVTLRDDVLPDDEDTVPGQITDQGGPGPGPAVGWETYPINKVRVFLPWIALLAAIAVGSSLLVLRRRRAHS